MNRPGGGRLPLASLLALVGMLGVAGSPNDAPRDPPPPERRPPPKPSSGNPFHDHIDVCAFCRRDPFALCEVGAAALENAAMADSASYFARQPPPPVCVDDRFEWRMPLPRIAPMSAAQSIQIVHAPTSKERTIAAARAKRARKAAVRLARKGGAT